MSSGPRRGSTIGDAAHMFRHAVSGRKRGDDLAGAGNRLGVDHHDAGMLVAEVDHQRRAVRIDRPEMMVQQLIAVDILPAHVQHAAVGQHPRRVFLFGVVGEHADVAAVGVAAVQRGHLGPPARHEPMAAAGAEDDAAVGRVDRLDVVVRSVRQLPEIRRRRCRFRTGGTSRCRPAIREQNLPAVVMDLRIADPAVRIVQQDLQLAGPQIQAAQASAVAKGEPLPIAFEQRRAV